MKTLEDLNLSVRAYNAVRCFGIDTVEELSERIDEFSNHAPKYGAEARKALEASALPQAQTAGVIVESADYTKAVSLHRKICVSAELAEQNLFEFCKGLCEMRDYKLYRELGCKTFEDYCVNELKISLRQGQKYAAIASLETIGNAKSTSHFEKLGTEKLYLLSRIEEDARIEIMEKTDIENVSVRELKKQIAQLEKDLKDQQGNYAMHTKRREDEIAGYKERQDKLLTRNKELVNELERTEEKLDQAENDLDEANETVQSLSRQLEELESRPRDSYEDTTKIEELKKQLAEAEQRAGEANRSAYSDNAVFNAYASAATDAMRRLTQFCEQHSSSSEKTVFVAKLKMIVTLTGQTIEKLGG